MKTSYYHHQNNSEMGTSLFQSQVLTDHFKSKMHEDHQNLLENHHYLQHQRTNSTSTMTYSKPKTKALKNSKSLELPNAISTKFNKVQDFKLDNLETIINILEYRTIPIEKCKIIIRSVKIPTGKGRLYLSNDTISRKMSIVTVKNDDTTCLVRSIVMAMANLHPEK